MNAGAIKNKVSVNFENSALGLSSAKKSKSGYYNQE